MIEILIFFLITTVLSTISNRFKFLSNFSGDFHQKFLNEKETPLIGGILFLLSLLYLFYEKNFFLSLSIFFIFCAGFFSDLKILISPKYRIFLQTLIISLSVYFLDISIASTRIEILDRLIEISFFNIIFTTFCILILLNGSNFVDGLNGLLIGYTIIILSILIKLNLLDQIFFEEDKIIFLFFSLIILLIFNYLNLFYLGDSGSYLIGFILGYLLIKVYFYSNSISPFSLFC